MSLGVIRLTLRTRRLAIFWFDFGILALGLLIMGLWPLFAENWDDLTQAMGGSEVFGGTQVEGASAQQNTFYSYFSSQYTSTLMLVLAYFGVWFGAGLITRDFGSGTLDVLLAAPMSRTRFLLSRIAALLVLTTVVVAASYVAILVGAAIWAREVELGALELLVVHLQMLVFTLAVAGGGLLLATLILQPGRTYGLAAGIIVIMFVLADRGGHRLQPGVAGEDQHLWLLEPGGPAGARRLHLARHPGVGRHRAGDVGHRARNLPASRHRRLSSACCGPAALRYSAWHHSSVNPRKSCLAASRGLRNARARRPRAPLHLAAGFGSRTALRHSGPPPVATADLSPPYLVTELPEISGAARGRAGRVGPAQGRYCRRLRPGTGRRPAVRGGSVAALSAVG